jgi:hypothetical protein
MSMRLRAFRDSWMWLAVSACGAPGWVTKSSSPKVTIFDAPPLAGAKYVATIDQGDFGHPGPRVAIEHGSFECRQLVELLHRNSYNQAQDDELIESAQEKCDLAVAKLLREPHGFVFVVDGTGPRWLTAEQVLEAAAPIDTPAKALLAVWVRGTYDLSWGDGKRYYGSPEDGLVRKVDGGYEVIGSTTTTDGDCGGSHARETVTSYRHTLFVDGKGEVRERGKVVAERHNIADPCHPMGRRPADFADVASGGTVRGHLLRAMHHEAESVRAFERIARELQAYEAPQELCEAAVKAASDERDHAERCAALLGERVVVASDDLPVRPLLELAIDNAREGCVGESYAALVAAVQAREAMTPSLRAHFAAIAIDEIAHAALAHAIASWLDGHMTHAERAQVRAAREVALRELAASCEVPSSAALRVLGAPTGVLAAQLLDAVARVS